MLAPNPNPNPNPNPSFNKRRIEEEEIWRGQKSRAIEEEEIWRGQKSKSEEESSASPKPKKEEEIWRGQKSKSEEEASPTPKPKIKDRAYYESREYFESPIDEPNPYLTGDIHPNFMKKRTGWFEEESDEQLQDKLPVPEGRKEKVKPEEVDFFWKPQASYLCIICKGTDHGSTWCPCWESIPPGVKVDEENFTVVCECGYLLKGGKCTGDPACLNPTPLHVLSK